MPATVYGVETALALGAKLCNITDAAAVLAVGLRDKLRQSVPNKG